VQYSLNKHGTESMKSLQKDTVSYRILRNATVVGGRNGAVREGNPAYPAQGV
jgi:hypothetical protein